VQDVHKDPERRSVVTGDHAKFEVEIVWIYYYHGCFLTVTGDPRYLMEAKKSFATALKYHKKCQDLHYEGLPKQYALQGGLANAFNGLGEQIDAEQAYLKAIELKPETELFPAAETNLCRCLCAQGPGRLKEASDRLEKIIADRLAHYGPDDKENFMYEPCTCAMMVVSIANKHLKPDQEDQGIVSTS
jgi:tetratricopeptide (TPR) repeat protein